MKLEDRVELLENVSDLSGKTITKVCGCFVPGGTAMAGLASLFAIWCADGTVCIISGQHPEKFLWSWEDLDQLPAGVLGQLDLVEFVGRKGK